MTAAFSILDAAGEGAALRVERAPEPEGAALRMERAPNMKAPRRE